jgi:lambda repressor-like predicted transcriptional regulator
MMQTEMTDQIRKLVIVEMAKRGIKQKDLAKKVGRSPQQLNNVLRRDSSDMPDVWQEIFKTFDWEIRVFDKEGNEVK